MADQEHVERLRKGVVDWNEWRKNYPSISPDLSNADLYQAKLYRANLAKANLNRAILRRANLIEADLSYAKLKAADLREADLLKANLSYADLQYARLRKTYLGNSILEHANCSHVDATWARLFQTQIDYASFKGAKFGHTILADINFRHAKNLSLIQHDAPSSVGYDTLILSFGCLPENFLRACNISTDLLSRFEDLYGDNPRQSCFISYSSKDSAFAMRLRDALNEHRVYYWFAPDHATWGRDLTDEITDGISAMDRVILICSKNSLNDSDWVNYELSKTIEEEDERKKRGMQNWRMIFPIKLDDTLDNWNHKLSPRLKEVLAGDFRRATSGKGKLFMHALDRLINGLERPKK